MNVSQKCQYALRAIFELSKRAGRGPTKIGVIAEAQAIPPRFLELILNELKHAGFVESSLVAEQTRKAHRCPQLVGLRCLPLRGLERATETALCILVEILLQEDLAVNAVQLRVPEWRLLLLRHSVAEVQRLHRIVELAEPLLCVGKQAKHEGKDRRPRERPDMGLRNQSP